MGRNSKDISLIKDKAERYFLKGRLQDALEAYRQIKELSRKDPRVLLRLGDLYRKTGQSSEAVAEYKEAAGVFIRQGFIIKAIAVCKMIVAIDPSQEEVQKRLAELYAKRSGGEEKREEAQQPARESEKKVAGERSFPRTPLFSDLQKNELFDLMKRCKYRTVPEGTLIIKEGDAGDSLYVISSGEVDVIGTAGDGKEILLARLGEGDFFGEFGCFTNSKRRSSVRARVPTELLEIEKRDMSSIAKRYPRVSTFVFNFYKERVVDRLMALSPIFSPLSSEDRVKMVRRLTLKKVKSSTDIIKEGAKGDTMFLIKSGKVEVWMKDDGRGRMLLATMEEGDFFGEIALTTTKPRLATVTALTDVEFVMFSRAVIRDIFHAYPQVKDILQKVIKQRVVAVVKAHELQSAALV
ncbi:MAG: cyclic nucleotide-binding domain-containing protein [Thermodesulfobacteriota bacterium]